jgi:diguanylate cyclase (GGDEF)-like protein
MAVRGHAIVDDNGRVTGGVEGLRDIEIERSYREQLHFLAEHDALSQLVNRSGFLAQIGKLLHHEVRSGSRIALLFIDIDGFKMINDTRGHEAGDIVISELARRIMACVRTDDVVARYGGDEFVAALTAVHDIDDAQAVADKIQVAVRAPIVLNSHSIRVAVSIGIALVEPGEGMSESLRRADLALYAAKAQGRDRSVTYEQALRT